MKMTFAALVAVAALGFTACVTGAVLLRGHRAPTQPTSGTGTGAANAATADSPAPGSPGFLLAGLLMSLVVFIPLVHITASATRLGLSPGHGAAVLAVIGEAGEVGLSGPAGLPFAHGLTSSTWLKGVSATLAKRVNPPVVTTSRMRRGPAWVPMASPTSWESDAGVHSSVENP